MPISVIDLLVQLVCRGQDLPFKWIEDIRLTTEIIAPLVEKCRRHLPSLLTTLSELHFCNIGVGRHPSPRDMQRILRLASKTEDPRTLSGALIALSTSDFLQLAEPELVLKMIGAESSQADFSSRIFEGRDVVVALFGRVSSQLGTKGTEVAKEVARAIASSPTSYAFRVRCAAADFLAEHDQIDLPPLLLEEKQLGIQIQEA